MRSVMKKDFGRLPVANIPRSVFNRSHGVKTTFNADELVPILVDELYPGDTFNLSLAGVIRMLTPLYPVMDNMFVDTFFFSVPLRILQTNFPKLLGEQDNPGDSVDYLTPKVTLPTYVNSSSPGHEGKLYDYFGWPIRVMGANGITGTNYCGRAYNMIWNEWFRNQNLQNSVVEDKDDGPDDPADYTLLKRCKRHDYFTSCLPWPQKFEAQSLPLGTVAPVEGIGAQGQTYATTSQAVYETGGSGTVTYANAADVGTTGNFYIEEDPNSTGFPGVYANLANATAATINQLRLAFQVQRMYEIDARSGTRMVEIIKAHFNVTNPDFRAQRPEYLGGGSTPINVTPVATTADAGTDVGELGGFVSGVFTGHGFSKSFTEHSILIGLINIRADVTYQQGLERQFTRDDRLDLYWPSLAMLGEQAVLNKEIYYQGTSADDDVFGYQERFGELRHKNSQITGWMRSAAASTYDPWHLSQDFSTKPDLDDTFIQANTPIERVLAVASSGAPHFWADLYHNMRCARPLPVYGIPGSLMRF